MSLWPPLAPWVSRLASCLYCGSNFRQWPHQGAKKSTRTSSKDSNLWGLDELGKRNGYYNIGYTVTQIFDHIWPTEEWSQCVEERLSQLVVFSLFFLLHYEVVHLATNSIRSIAKSVTQPQVGHQSKFFAVPCIRFPWFSLGCKRSWFSFWTVWVKVVPTKGTTAPIFMSWHKHFETCQPSIVLLRNLLARNPKEQKQMVECDWPQLFDEVIVKCLLKKQLNPT